MHWVLTQFIGIYNSLFFGCFCHFL